MRLAHAAGAIGLTLAFAFVWAGERDESLYDIIDRGTMITVESYDPATQTYRVAIEFDSRAPSHTTREFLAEAMKELNSASVRRPGSIVGNQYKLDRDLTIFSEKGMRQRRQPQRARKAGPPLSK